MTETKQMRYSDAILEEYRISIEAKLEKALAEREVLKASIIGLDSNGTNDTGAKISERENEAAERELIQKLLVRKNCAIDGYVRALARISTKTFGICRVTGELIPRERLDACPSSDLCIEEQKKDDKINRR